jgi:hypothetical protein
MDYFNIHAGLLLITAGRSQIPTFEIRQHLARLLSSLS